MLTPSLRGAECDEAIHNWIATPASQARNDELVFLPGWGFHASVMQPLAKLFPNKTVHYADLPLIEDDSQTFQTIVEKLNVSLPANSTLIAWSLGGLFAIALCARYPEKYKKLILLASTPKFDHSFAKSFLLEAEINLPYLIKHFHRLVCFPNKDKALRSHLVAHSLTHESSLRFYLKLLFKTDLTSEFGKLTQPVFQIMGEKDVIVQYSQADLIIAGGGHGFFLTDKRHCQLLSDVPRTFNKAAKTYDLHSQLQQHIGKKLISLLPKNTFENVIDLGCGSGLTTGLLADKINAKQFYAIDNASELLSISKKNLINFPIYLQQLDFNQLSKLNKSFDLIFSNMALHWSQTLETTLNEISSQTKAQGIIAFSIPLHGTFKELKNHFSVNAQASTDQIINYLRHANYNILLHQHEIHTLQFESTLAALRSIKYVGATHVNQRKHKSLLSKSYLQQHPINQLTYHIGYFVAERI